MKMYAKRIRPHLRSVFFFSWLPLSLSSNLAEWAHSIVSNCSKEIYRSRSMVIDRADWLTDWQQIETLSLKDAAVFIAQVRLARTQNWHCQQMVEVWVLMMSSSYFFAVCQFCNYFSVGICVKMRLIFWDESWTVQKMWSVLHVCVSPFSFLLTTKIILKMFVAVFPFLFLTILINARTILI